MLAKRRPYTASTPMALLHQHLDAPIPRLPAGLEPYQELVDVLMAKNREDRFENAKQLRDYLEPLLAA